MPTTAKGAATRRRIIDAAWLLSDECAVPLLGGVSLRDIAQAAGLTPAAVTYHFPMMSELVVAMAEQIAESTWPLLVEMVDALLDQAADEGFAKVAHLAAEANWSMLVTAEDVTVQRRLARCYSAGEQHPRVRDAIAGLHRSWVEDMSLLYGRTLARLGLRVVEPFTVQDLALAVSTAGEGLQFRWMVDPDSVRSGLFADVVVALLSAMVVPDVRPVSLEEVAIALRRPNGERRSGDRPPLTDGTTELALLFADGIDTITLTGVGHALGCGPAEVVELYGSLRCVAALTFHRHFEVVEAAARRRVDQGAEVALTDAVYELARVTLGDRHCALALLHERQRSAVDERADWDLRTAVPFGPVVAGPLGQVLGGATPSTDELADVLVDTVLGIGATNRRVQPAEVTEMALRLVPLNS